MPSLRRLIDKRCVSFRLRPDRLGYTQREKAGTIVNVTFNSSPCTTHVCDKQIHWPRGIPPTPWAGVGAGAVETWLGSVWQPGGSRASLPPTSRASLTLRRVHWLLFFWCGRGRFICINLHKPFFRWKIPRRWRYYLLLTAGCQWRPYPQMLRGGMLSSWLSGTFTRRNFENGEKASRTER